MTRPSPPEESAMSYYETTLTVGVGQQYQTIAAAIAVANQIGYSVDIKISAGTYINDGGVITASYVFLEGIGGTPKLIGANAATGGIAAISVFSDSAVIANLDIAGVTDADGSGAAIYNGFGELYLSNVHLHDNQVGISTYYDPDYPYTTPDGSIAVSGSEIDHNGSNIDVGRLLYLGINTSSIHDAQSGPEIRSRAGMTVLYADVIADNASHTSYSLEIPAYTLLAIENTTIEKGPNAQGGSILSVAEYGAIYETSQVDLTNDRFINDVFPNTDTLLSQHVSNLVAQSNTTWNLPNVGAPAGFTALAARPATPTLADLSQAPTVAITIITGNRDGGVTLAGRATAGTTVTVADAAGGQTALIGSATVGSNGRWSLTSHAKINVATTNTYTASTTDGYGNVGVMPGALILADTGTDSIVARASVAEVFAVMSFKGSEVIHGFQTASAVGAVHDVLNFSGRNITSFAQTQAMMSGSASTILTMMGGKTITLESIAPTTLSAADFAYS